MRRWIAGIGAAAVLAAAVVFWIGVRGRASSAATPAASQAAGMPQSAMQAEVDASGASVDAVNRLLDALPAELTDVDALAGSLHSPQQAFVFVRDQIAYEAYAGVQKGAWGALSTRGANDLDKALLLAALLKAQGVDVQLAHGTVDEQGRGRLAAEASARPDAMSLSLKALKGPASAIPHDRGDQDFADQFNASVARRQAAVRAAVDQAFGQLAPIAPQAAPTTPPDTDHYWIQAKIDDKDVDFDPSLGANSPGSRVAAAAETIDPDALPDERFQTVQFTVVAAYLDAGALTEKTVLDATVRAADLLGKPLRLAITPQLMGASAGAFQAQLRADQNVTTGDVFELHDGGQSQDAGDNSAAGLGGLGGIDPGADSSTGAAGKPPKDAKGPSLARLWLDVVESAPGQPPFKVRRVILDRLNAAGTALAPGQTDALARLLLAQIWDGAEDAGAFAAPFVLRTQNAELASARQGGGATIAAQTQGGEADDLPAPVLSSSLVSLFFASDLARHFLGSNRSAAIRTFYRVPRLAFIRRGFRVVDWTASSPAAAYSEGTDLLDPALAFVGAPAAARECALRAGITDTALEARVGSARMRTGTLAVFGALPPGAVPQRYTQAAGLPKTLPPAVRRALAEDLSTQQIIMAPPAVASVNGAHVYGWWSFAAGTPYALGKLDLGGGQVLAEISEARKEVADKIMPFAKFYGAALRCYMNGLSDALAGGGPVQPTGLQKLMPGDQKKFVECMVSAVCDLVADLIADKIGEFAGEEQERVKLGEEIEEYNALRVSLASKAAGLWADGAKKGGVANCEAAAKGALK